MDTGGCVLLADDEELFLESTAQLLRRAGYECDCAEDAGAATQMLGTGNYDLLISDIKMPGNPGLEFIQKVPEISQGLPVILVTGYPSVETAILSIELHVASYMVKPLDFDRLLDEVRRCIQRRRLFKDVSLAQQRSEQTLGELARLQAGLRDGRTDAVPVTVDAFLLQTYGNIASSVLDAYHLREAMDDDSEVESVCNLLGCPTLFTLQDALREAIEVIDGTKSVFKSKELRNLRLKLEGLVQSMKLC